LSSSTAPSTDCSASTEWGGTRSAATSRSVTGEDSREGVRADIATMVPPGRTRRKARREDGRPTRDRAGTTGVTAPAENKTGILPIERTPAHTLRAEPPRKEAPAAAPISSRG